MGNSALKRETIQPLPELKDALQRLLGEKLVKLVLFGSMARGDWFERSDIDIAIGVKGLSRDEAPLKAATVLFEKTLLNDAVSRLYYFLLYNIRALLLTKGLEPKSHESAL